MLLLCLTFFVLNFMSRYGDAERMFRTHLFGSPSIIASVPSINKLVLRTDDAFIIKWPNIDIMGSTSLVVVDGKSHARIRSFVFNAFKTLSGVSLPKSNPAWLRRLILGLKRAPSTLMWKPRSKNCHLLKLYNKLSLTSEPYKAKLTKFIYIK